MNARSLLRAVAILVVVVCAIAVAVHTDWFKDIARRRTVAFLDARLGGELAIDVLDYQLWRGQVRLSGVRWASEDAAVTIRADEIGIALSARRIQSLSVVAPEVRIRAADGDASDSTPWVVPAWAFDIAMTFTNGRLVTEAVEVDDVDVHLEPGVGFWDGDLAARGIRVARDETLAQIDSLLARFRIEPNRAEIVEARMERGASYVEVAATIDELSSSSPLAIESRVTYSIDEALVRELAPDVGVAESVIGSARLRLDSGVWSGEGDVRTSGLAVAPLQPLDVRASWRLDGDAIHIDSADVAGYGGSAVVAATHDLETNTQSIEVSLEALELDPRLGSRVSGTASLTLQNWERDDARGHAELELRPELGGDGVALRGTVSLDLEGAVLTVDAPRLTGPGFELAASGEVSDVVSLRYTVSVDNVAALEWLPDAFSAGSMVAAGEIDGPLASPVINARVSSAELVVSSVPVEVEARLMATTAVVNLESLAVRRASGGALEARGSYDIDSETFSLRGRSDELALRDIAKLEGFEADVSAVEFDFSGALDAPVGSAEADVRNIRFRDVALPAMRISVEGDGAGARLTASVNGEEVASARVEAKAPHVTEVDIVISEVLPLGALVRTLPGYLDTELSVEGGLHANGSLSELETFRFRLDTEQVVGSFRGVGFGVSSPFVVEGDREAVSVRDLILVGADTAIGIDGVLPLTPDGSMDVEARGVARLELLSLWAPELAPSGQVDLELRVTGALPDPDLVGDIGVSGASGLIQGLSVDDVNAHVRFDQDAITIDRLAGQFLGGRFEGEGEVPSGWRGDALARVRFRIDDIDPSLADVDNEWELGDSSMRLAMSGELVGPVLNPPAWNGTGQIESLVASAGGLALHSESAVSWTLAGGHFRLAELRLIGDETDFFLEAELSPFAEPVAWSARASGRIDPAFAAPTLAELGMVFTGGTEFDIRARQSIDPLTIEGSISVDNGRLSVREPPLTFTNLNAAIVLANETVTLTRLDANVGGGTVQADGEILLSGTTVASVDLHGRARSVRLSYPEGLRSEVDATVALSGMPPAMRLTGDVALARAIFSSNINVQSELLQSLSTVRTLTHTESFADSVELDVRVRTREGLRIDNNLAQMDASANLTLGGTLAEPELFGTVAARQGGEFRFGRNVYRIESGVIGLNGYPIEAPTLDITARTTVSDYDLRLAVRGTTDDLRTNISGTSKQNGREISQADVAALLVTGRTVDGVSSEGRTILGEQMASYLGSSLADLAQFGLAGALPFDIVTVEPALIAGEADPSARFTLGAALTDELSVVYSVGLNDAENQIWIVDYKLPRSTRTQLIRQEDTEFTFAFGQRVEFDRKKQARTPSVRIATVSFYFISGEPGDIETDARTRLRTNEGQSYEYWKTWERAEALRDWLREDGFLEATVDFNAKACGDNCVDLDVVVITGKRVRFVWQGDELDGALKRKLVASWDGYMTPAFLASELRWIAEGDLFEHRYYQASVDVDVEESPSETVVTVRSSQGARGARVDIVLTGNDAVAAPSLLVALPKRSSREFHELITSKRPRLKQILEVQYASFGYLQVEIGDPTTHFDVTDGALLVTIPIVEGEPAFVESVEVQGAERIPEATLRSRLSLHEGARFNVTQFVQDRSALSAYYRREGFPEVKVDSSVLAGEALESLVVRYVVDEGPEITMGELQISGNDVTRDSVIRREVSLQEGQPLRLTDVSTTQKRLYELGIFRSADVVIADGEAGSSRRDVVIEVAEVPDVVVNYGLRYTTGGLFQVLAEVGAPNLLGRAQRISFRTLFGVDERIFRFSYRTPYIARYKLDTDFFLERDVTETTTEDSFFVDRSWRITAQQTRPLWEKVALQWSYSFRRTATELDIPVLGEPIVFSRNRSILTGALVGDLRNNVVSPTRGAFWNLTAQAAPEMLGASSKFFKVYSQAYTFFPLGGGVVWASGYRLGLTNDFGERLEEEDRFQAGGPSSVRGFEQGTLGPTDDIVDAPIGGAALVVVNQEIRFPLVWRLRGVGFYDVGNVFDDPSNVSFSDLRHSAGAGLRLELPFGLIRLDWARVLDPREGDRFARFIFSLGHAF